MHRGEDFRATPPPLPPGGGGAAFVILSHPPHSPWYRGGGHACILEKV